MTNIILFQFELSEVRTGDVDGKVVVCLSDLLLSMESKTDTNKARASVEEVFGDGQFIELPITDNLGREQKVLFVFEAGATFLVSRSRTAKGKRMNRWIHSELIPSIRKTGSYSILPQPVESQSKQLLIEQSKVVAQCVDDIQNILSKSNPRLAQLLIDIGVNDFVESNQPKSIAAAEFPDDRWYSLVSIAEKMEVKTNSSTRVMLGQFIASKGFDRVKEDRLCNGEMRPIWCYRDNEETRAAIKEWAEAQV